MQRRNFRSTTLFHRNLVDYINNNQNLWKAEINKRFVSLKAIDLLRFLGTNRLGTNKQKIKHTAREENYYAKTEIPESFDAREQWPLCNSIGKIQDQSTCSNRSCWAIAAVEAMSDRICIASNQTKQVMLSARDLLSCCSKCSNGCSDAGDPIAAWEYWNTEGIVTGSDFASNASCLPYPFPECDHFNQSIYHPSCGPEIYPTLNCISECSENYSKSYADDKYYGFSPYLLPRNVTRIQLEIMNNGPVEAVLNVYSDFMSYEKGIYMHVIGDALGGHSVKIIGWGVENSISYWLIVNSWNGEWGENGLFRMLRGTNECGIEENVVAGIPDFSR
ncbi:unnamed protein product [Dracunculus medinensis]|uniref:Pept_C1 domain-containing protein n=1 Tax=Dracunculus medinensis TaxID=318479 RepID=A0A0N4UIM8_DRAME|nr:unnamed protein product [Dracunculus medinensis]